MATTPSNENTSILDYLHRLADSVNYTPKALITLGAEVARWKSKVILQAEPPWPVEIETADITDDQLNQWPEWVGELVSPGSRWERMEWEDGSYSIRLVTKRAQVLAGKHFAEATPD